MKAGFIGAGKVGFSLGRYFTENNIEVTGYYSRSPESARKAADFTNTRHYDSIESILGDSDTLFLTVPDGQIASVWDHMRNLDIKNKNICHCSGSISSATFFHAETRGAKVYSVHPLYAVSDKFNSWKALKDAVFTMEGTPDGIEPLRKIFESCGNRVVVMDGSKKALYHGAAVVCSNLTAGLFSVATQILQHCGFDQETASQALVPLFLGNAQAIAERGPVDALTGPIERNDVGTVQKHFAAFDEVRHTSTNFAAKHGESADGENANLENAREIYRLLSEELVKLAETRHPDRDYSELLEVLKNEKHCNHI